MLAELGLVLDPVEDVVREEALCVYAVGVDLVLFEGVDEVLGVLLLGVAVEGHGDFGSLELRGEFETPGVDLLDVGVEGEECAAGGVEVGTEVGRAVHVFFYGCGVGVEAIHFSAEREELVLRDVRGAAFGGGGLAVCGGLEGCGALCAECGVEDVRGGVQVALRVAAYELLVFGESDIALEDTGALSAGSIETFERVLRELEGSTAVGDNEVSGVEGSFRARLELLLQRTFVHVIDEVVGSVANLDIELGAAMASVVTLRGHCGGRGREQRESSD